MKRLEWLFSVSLMLCSYGSEAALEIRHCYGEPPFNPADGGIFTTTTGVFLVDNILDCLRTVAFVWD
jgi:hypothetical protein